MGRYKFFKKKSLEKLSSYETRLNEEAARGWKVVNMTSDNGQLMALLERER